MFEPRDVLPKRLADFVRDAGEVPATRDSRMKGLPMDDAMPKYDGVLEPWKVDLIIARAKCMGFRKDELPDLMQDLALILSRFEYDPDRADGAKEGTAVQAVVDNHLLFARRTAERYQAAVEAGAPRSEPMCDAEDDELAYDVQEILETLPEQERLICLGLAEGRSKDELAAQLGCSWHTVHKAVRRMASHFRELGLEGWPDR